MPRLQQNSFKTRSRQPGMQPLRQWPSLKPDPLTAKPSDPKKATSASDTLVTFASFTILPCASTTHTLDSSNVSIPA